MEPPDWPERRDVFKLCSDALSLQEVVEAARSPKCGAVSVFLGTTREDVVNGQKVIGLEYQAYESMVQSELSKLSRVIRESWPHVMHICLHHRLGWVSVGEASVIVAVSAPHRRDSEEAVQFCVTQLKALVPIWKKEVFEGGQCRWNENSECGWSQNHRSKTRTKTETKDQDQTQDHTQP
ncbi:hypothetical protein NQD34_009253 [Periophthalmus magnuspinnatus]|nr:hypothetical protein NQD34_009253 [Periophthalmus magnuspinnatus]